MVAVGVIATSQIAVIGLATPAVAADIATVSCDDPVGAADAPSPLLENFEPMAPERVLDTRKGTGGVDGALDAGCTLRVDTSTLIPADASAIALSLTVVSPDIGFFTAFACSAGLPETSNVNARGIAPTANLVMVAPDDGGDVCIYSSAGGHVILDVSGWWAPGPNRFSPIDPARAIDTRQETPANKLAGGEVRGFPVAGPVVPDDAVAVAINVAAVQAAEPGFLVAYPCGGDVPFASNLNFVAGENRAASAIVEVGEGGEICVQSNVETHVIADVTGYYSVSDSVLSFVPSGPTVGLRSVADTRVADTRTAARPGNRFAAGTTQRFDLKPFIDAPDETVAAALNVVAVRAESFGFVTVYPCTDPRPTTSSLNYDGGQTANLIVSKLTGDGEVCVFTSTGVDLAIDLFGTFSETASPVGNGVEFQRAGAAALAPDQDFDEGFDYTFRCVEGGENLNVALDLGAQVTAQVNGRAVTNGVAAASVPNDGLVTVTLASGSLSQDYAFRCLPPDFPTYDVTTTKRPAPGWYTYTTNLGNFGDGYVVIMDERFVPVWFKKTTGVKADFKALSTGDVVAGSVEGQGFGVNPDEGHRIWNLEGDLVDFEQTVKPPADQIPVGQVGPYPTDFHEYEEIVTPGQPSGRAVLSYPRLEGQDLSGIPSGCCTGDTEVVGGVIQEFDGADDLQFNWDVVDHFGYDEVLFPAPVTVAGERVIDPFHLNSVDRVDDGTGDYVVSARHLDAVFRVNRATEKVEWILSPIPSDPSAPEFVANKGGGKRLEIVGDPFGGPRRQHDARLVGNRLTMFDNRTATIFQPARFVEYEIDVAAGTATMVRQILQPGGMLSQFAGNARVTPDGSVLAAWVRTEPLFVEYDADGNELQRLTNDPTDSTYRIIKFGPETFDMAELRATSGGRISNATS